MKLTTLLCIMLVTVGRTATNQFLVEAESFQNKGGWKVDQQFVHVMGSPYLLAHGYGEPVENASTEVKLPATGDYYLWVRTKNWVPGPWVAPGRFQIMINNQLIETEFGTETGWNWQRGGKVKIAQTDIKISLKDLTGFDGRCDAIFFTTDKSFTPPNKPKELYQWRNKLSGLPKTPKNRGRYDVVVIGGGIAGCGAALAAESKGLKVALIHDRPVLGGNASKEIRVHTLGITGKSDKILKGINTRHWPNGSVKAIEDNRKRQQTMDKATGVTQFLGWRAYNVKMSGSRIKSVDMKQIESGETGRLDSNLFIDCTGDGWIGFWAGADFRYGCESKNEFNEGWEKHGELWSPKNPDNKVMGTSLLWNSRELKEKSTFPEVPWAMGVAKSLAKVAGDWYWEYSDDKKHQIDDAQEIRDHMLRAIYGTFANAKKSEKYAFRKLKWVGYVGDKRESRRLIGDYIYGFQDAVKGTYFPDTVVEEVREIDVHYQKSKLKNKSGVHDFQSTALFKHTPKYYIPFRSLYSKTISNLMMAGRCFSCTHVGLGGPRVMNTTGQMGIATGYAAYLCKKYKLTPRQLGKTKIKELRKLIGYSDKK